MYKECMRMNCEDADEREIIEDDVYEDDDDEIDFEFETVFNE